MFVAVEKKRSNRVTIEYVVFAALLTFLKKEIKGSLDSPSTVCRTAVTLSASFSLVQLVLPQIACSKHNFSSTTVLLRTAHNLIAGMDRQL